MLVAVDCIYGKRRSGSYNTKPLRFNSCSHMRRRIPYFVSYSHVRGLHCSKSIDFIRLLTDLKPHHISLMVMNSTAEHCVTSRSSLYFESLAPWRYPLDIGPSNSHVLPRTGKLYYKTGTCIYRIFMLSEEAFFGKTYAQFWGTRRKKVARLLYLD